MSGDDSMTLPLLSVGGVGVISVIANIIPTEMAALVKAWEDGDRDKALELHQKLFYLGKNMLSLETNPGPVKAAMEMLGKKVGKVRLPLATLDEANKSALKKVLADFGLL